MKNCLLVLRSKKVALSGEETQRITSIMSSGGYYFDRIICVDFSCNDEITSALRDCKNLYENSVIILPSVMKSAVVNFVTRLYGGTLNSSDVLNIGTKSVFLVTESSSLTPERILAELNKKYGGAKYTQYVKTVGAPSDVMDRALNAAAQVGGDIEYKVYGAYGESTIELIYSDVTPKIIVDGAHRALVSGLEEYIYALENQSLAETLFNILKLRKMKICVAESFTGGGICKRLVEVSGISEVFYEGLNTYSNQSKRARLGVKELTLKQYGAVSDQTAREMAQGLLNGGNCDLAISTTGIAGPNSDNTNKPVGLCYIGIALKSGTKVYKYKLSGDRKTITETAINQALFLAYKSIKSIK